MFEQQPQQYENYDDHSDSSVDLFAAAASNNNQLQSLHVAEMRKALHHIRSAWRNHSSANPIMLSEIVLPRNGMSMAEFTFNTVLLRHCHRHNKSQHARTGSRDNYA